MQPPDFGQSGEPTQPTSPAAGHGTTSITVNSVPSTPYPEAAVPASTFNSNIVTGHSFNDSSIREEAFAVPSPPTDDAPPNQLSNDNLSDKPVPVVKVLSVRGVEYGMMTITLWIAAASLAGGAVSMINGGVSFSILALPISLLLVCLPVFAFFFLRLKKAEIANPNLRLEASKRRFSQITQFLAYLVCLINVIVFVYLIMASFGSEKHTSWPKAIGDLIVILAVAGGILFYYWVDEHKLVK